jgi:hypothetical protein
MKHLSIRVAWHDNKWDGTVCCNPSLNSFCTHLPRINQEKKPDEDKQAKQNWAEIDPTKLPPCKAESGGFMNTKSYRRTFSHPYNYNRNLPHNKLRPTIFAVPEYSTFAVPFWWMLRKNQSDINEISPNLPSDETPNFPTSWVFGKERQQALLKLFFQDIHEKQSLAIFYTKSGNPVDEETKRLVVGIGLITKLSKVLEYESDANYTYPLWDRLISHNIRPEADNSEGVLIPYHEYLALDDNFKLKTKTGFKTKEDLLNEIKLTLNETATSEDLISEFSYGCEHVENSTILNLLSQLRIIIERIKEHGVVKGNWDKQLLWINKQIGLIKEQMGPFPSFGNALVAMGFQYGHLLEHDMRENGLCKTKDNPWNIFEDLIYGVKTVGKTPYSSDLPFYRDTWVVQSNSTKELLYLLSRFELTAKQIKTWQSAIHRKSIGCTVSEQDILENPYLIAEDDIGNNESYPISVDTIDLGVFEDKAIQGEYTPEKPSLVESPIDKRRVRALICSILKRAATNGDTLLSINEINEWFSALKLQRVSEIPDNYIHANIDFIKERLVHVHSDDIDAIQLKIYDTIETFLSKTFLARAKKELTTINEDWGKLIIETIQSDGIKFDTSNPRHSSALQDQTRALAKLTSRKLTILHGAAGTGKTTIMGALFKSKQLSNEGILLLAPTGKARVRLGKMAKSEAYTIAQFLTKQNRFDWERMKPKLDSKTPPYQGEQNVIIDECSMLTEEDFYAVLKAIDLAHVKRIVLVGDPFQLPPIGAGRPFADLCNYLENLSEGDNLPAKEALARLEVIVRTRTDGESDTLTLASWFGGLKPLKNADEIFEKICDNKKLNDLRFECWNKPEDLEKVLLDTLISELGLNNENDYEGFNLSLGIGGTPSIKNKPEQIENHQVLTPVKNPVWGAFEINRLVQSKFRKALWKTEKPITFGSNLIGRHDKVIQLINEKKEAFPTKETVQLSNGQIGSVDNIYQGRFANIVFTGCPNQTFGAQGNGAENDSTAIELAYAITIHKSQGSDFQKVFLVIPKTGRLLSRELVYTALTRAKDKLIVLIEGDSPHWIFTLSKSQRSNTAERNTNLFTSSIRDCKSSIPFVEGLIHKTLKEGLFVRSKSEVIIANMLIDKGVEFEYEREFINDNSRRIPDFTFIDAAGDIIILEHLGMLNKPTYRDEWEKKLTFYENNGFKIGANLFITQDNDNGAIDSIEIERVISKIQEQL